MAGFQVANFSFGKNIKDDERQRAIAAMNNATTRRGQDMQAAQADANRAENVRQFDAQMAEREAQREEGARQFDERMGAEQDRLAEGARQFDTVQNLKERQHAESRADIERAQSWDDAIKLQQMEADDMKYQKWSAELNDFIERGNRDREEYERKMQAQREIQESALGMVSEGVFLSGDIGAFTPSQVKMFNEKFGQSYDCIGKRDMLTGQPYDDGLIHLVKYERDKDGNVIYGYIDANGKFVQDQQRQNRNSQPALAVDVSVPREDYETGLGRLRQYGDRARGRGGMSEERMQLERDKIGMREKELEARKNQAATRNKEMQTRLAASIARNFNSVRSGAGFDEESSKAFRQGLQNVLSDMFGLTQESNGGAENPTEQPKGEQQGQARQIGSPSEMADAPVGSWFVKGNKKYVKQENGQFLPEE